MPQQWLVQWTQQASPAQAGKRALVWSLDAERHEEIGTAIIIDRDPKPSAFLVDERNRIRGTGVKARSELEQEREVGATQAEAFERNQISALDEQHQRAKEEKELANAIQKQRREVARG